jgi:c-di-GMP-binding flagellar brake protein YcgR
MDLEKGKQCLLSVMDQYFMVEIVEVGSDKLKVTFPGIDYPLEGMAVALQFHDQDGINEYPSYVVDGPRGMENYLTLAKPETGTRTQHRSTCRVPTDLTMQVKDQIHVRKYDAALLNLSAGGCLIQTEGPFTLDSTLEAMLSLPGESTHTILAKVVHVASPGTSSPAGNVRAFGLRFIDPEPLVVRSISHYVWRRLREIYPSIQKA